MAGFKNNITWKVVLWLRHEKQFYDLAKECGDYEIFRKKVKWGNITPDVNWYASDLCLDEFNMEIKAL